MFFAKYEDTIGCGETLDEALLDLESIGNNYEFNNVTFYEGNKIKVILKVKETLIKVPKGTPK